MGTRRVLVDVGANRGDAACVFPHYGIKVFAFEPAPESFRWHLLTHKANMHLSEGSFPLTVFQGGASSTNTSVFYSDMGDSASNFFVKSEDMTANNNKGKVVNKREVRMFRVSDVVH